MNRKRNHTKFKTAPKRTPSRCTKCRSLAISVRYSRWVCRDCDACGRL